MARSKLAKRYGKGKKSNPSRPKSNPPLFMDLVEYIGPGFGSFAATRLATRMVSVQIAKRWPKLATHAGVLAGVGSFFAAWQLAHRVKFLERYHTPIVVGAGIAALESALELWFPKLGWITSSPAAEIAQASSPAQIGTGDDDDFEDVTDTEEGWHVYNGAHDAGRYERNQPRNHHAPAKGSMNGHGKTGTKNSAQAPGAGGGAEDGEDDLYEILGEDDNMQSAGAGS